MQLFSARLKGPLGPPEHRCCAGKKQNETSHGSVLALHRRTVFSSILYPDAKTVGRVPHAVYDISMRARVQQKHGSRNVASADAGYRRDKRPVSAWSGHLAVRLSGRSHSGVPSQQPNDPSRRELSVERRIHCSERPNDDHNFFKKFPSATSRFPR